MIKSILSQARAISGSPLAKRLKLRYRRSDFSLKAAAAAVALIVLLGLAIWDFIANASQKDQQVQESVLKGQLAEFLLMIREPDGSSLLENPAEFTKAQRRAQVVSVRRPFFGYFLHKGNVRSFRTEDFRWDPPRACVVEFAPEKASGVGSRVQACFAALPSDPAGRYVYFTLRYPSHEIRRHLPGRPAVDGDRVVLRFVGQRETRISLAFEAPPSVARHGSQVKRFDGLHELTGFLSDDGGRPSRFVSGQAFERRGDNSDQNFVTVLGRIDATLLGVADDGTGAWPTRAVKSLTIGVEIHPTRSIAETKPITAYAPDALGTALVSLEQAYLATISSRGNIEIVTGTGVANHNVIWNSPDADIAARPRNTDWKQRLSDRLARLLVSSSPPVKVRQQQTVAGLLPISVLLTTEPNLIPDIAARAFAWLITVLVALLILLGILLGAFWRLNRLARSARGIRTARSADRLAEYADSADQIGRLGRALHVLLKSDNARIGRHMKRIHREDAARLETMRHEAEQLKSRQAILDGIGHEIRSPLQSLLNNIPDDSEYFPKLERMRRAIEALYDATKLEDGLKNGTIVLRTSDVAEYIRTFVANLRDEEKPVTLIGATSGVTATFDPIALEQIMDHLIDNALRHLRVGTEVKISATSRPNGGVAVEVYNHGDPIPEDELDTIFNLGVTDRATPENKGQGLFVARTLALGMRATLTVENRTDGVAFVITLPPAVTAT